MNSTETEQIKKMIADLDAAVPRGEARVCLSQYGGGPDESKVVANERGYLRLGIEFLRAAFAPPSPKSETRIHADLGYLVTRDSTVGFDWFERREDLVVDTKAERKPKRLFPFIAMSGLGLRLFFATIVFAVIGVGTVIGWMTK